MRKMGFEKMMDKFLNESADRQKQLNKRNMKNGTKKRHIKGSYANKSDRSEVK